MIYTTLEINAPPSHVRDVLLDFPAYSTWHTSFIKTIASSAMEQAKEAAANTGEEESATNETFKFLKKGDAIHGLMGGVNFTALVLESTPHMLSWTGPPFYKLFRGIHTFRFSPSATTPGGTTFVQEESFTGIFAWMFAEWGPIGKKVKRMFEGFNQDLKTVVESKREETRDMGRK